MKYVLVVDDEDSPRRMISTILKKSARTIFSEPEDVYILEASNAKEALELIIEHKSTMLILIADIMMPGINGWELVDSARNLIPDLPVLVVSGVIKAELQLNSLERRCVWIQKPFSIKDFVDLVKLALNPTDPNLLVHELSKSKEVYSSMSRDLHDALSVFKKAV